MSRGSVLSALAEHLAEAKELAKRAAVDYSLVSEIDHLLKAALFNLAEEDEEKRTESAGAHKS